MDGRDRFDEEALAEDMLARVEMQAREGGGVGGRWVSSARKGRKQNELGSNLELVFPPC